MKGKKRFKRGVALSLSLALLLTVCCVPAMAEGEEPPEGGGPGGGGGTGAPSVDYQTLDVLGNYAAVFIRDGQVTTDDSLIETKGTIDSTTISDTYITSDTIGVWNKSTDVEDGIAGTSGIVILNTSTGDAADDSVVIGGEEDVFKVNGEDYNTVVILDNQDGDEPNTAYTDAEWTIDNGDNSNCTYPGVGIAVSAAALKIQNAYIETFGYHRPALATYDSQLAGDDNAQAPVVIVEDSLLASWGSEGKGSSAPTFTCMYGSARPVIINASEDIMFFNSKILSSDWGSYSLDQCSDTTVSIVNSYNENTVGGYGVYAIGSNIVNMYGTTSVSGQYGAIICAAGTANIYNLDKAVADSSLMENYDGTIQDDDALNEGGGSQMVGVNSAVTFTADISGANVVSTLSAEDTYFATVETATADDGSTIYSVLDTYDWLTNFAFISGGAPYFFLHYIDGATLSYRSVNSKLNLDNCQLESKNGTVIQTVLGYDTSANGIDVPDGTEYYGYDFNLSNMSVTGNILHEDYQRKMDLVLDNTDLTGAVVTGTMASWNSTMESYVDDLWQADDPAVGGVVGEVAEANDISKEAVVDLLEKNDSYETFWGTNLTLNDSDWTVTDTSSLTTLTVDQESSIQAPEGKTISFYVDVDMSNDDESFDVSTGTLVSSLEAGTYENVVIVVEDENPFTDVSASDYFYAPVVWAVEQGVTSGTSATTFSPNGVCTRAEMVQFLYNEAGKPAVAEGTVNPFVDVKEGAWYYDAVLWAVAEGITAGKDATHFAPAGICTRAEVMQFLYNEAGKPAAAEGTVNPFVDVEEGAWYYDAVLWAAEYGITSGTGDNTYSPNDACTRAQVVTFLYRVYAS